MAQVFPPASNYIARTSIILGVLLPVVLVASGMALTRSPFNTKVSIPQAQPIPFSHQHHALELGIDCRYCHTGVEKAGYAGIPPLQTCMSCHSQIWTNSPLLEPMRKAYRDDEPLKDPKTNTIGWTKINKLPDFVYFNHSIHINRGLNCNICHGAVQKMNLTSKGQAFFMYWCLECHRAPEKFVAERKSVFELYQKLQVYGDKLEIHGEHPTPGLSPEEHALANGQTYNRTPEELAKGEELVKAYGIKKVQLTDCWICHR
jgi:hypothetical protein